jgi:hypothetical protein
MHELAFRAVGSSNKAKPAGAVRLELFYQLVAPGAPVPPPPRADHGGPEHYLRSYSRSPVRLAPPMSRVPMLVVYWGRWADATGNVGPWSRTVQSRVEAWTDAMLFGASFASKKPAPMLDDRPAAQRREQKYSVAVRDAQYEYLKPRCQAPADGAAPQLEAPAADDVADAA